MARAERRGKVKFIGYVENDRGRDVKLWARFPVSKPLHDYRVTRLILRARPLDDVRRGTTVDKRNADAELIRDGRKLYLDYDRGTMGYAAVIGRLDKYDDCTDTVLWVMSSDTRIHGVFERTEGLPDHFLFTTYEKAMADFYGPIWSTAKVSGHNLSRDSTRSPTDAA